MPTTETQSAEPSQQTQELSALEELLRSKNKNFNDTNQYPPNINDWQKLPTFLKNHPQFSEQQMRWLLLHREINGLSQYTRKIGKPLYIYVPGFLEWIFKREER